MCAHVVAEWPWLPRLRGGHGRVRPGGCCLPLLLRSVSPLVGWHPHRLLCCRLATASMFSLPASLFPERLAISVDAPEEARGRVGRGGRLEADQIAGATSRRW